MEIEKKKLDKNLYSRQMAVYGEETMGKLVTYSVFIQGLFGTGIESAKNLILAGPDSVTLYDPQICTEQDRGVNFYVLKQDVGKISRAKASQSQLSELNGNVKIQIFEGEITEQVLSNYNIVIFTDFYDREKLILWNQFCRSKGIGFIYTGSLGLYGFAFVDYGDNHIVLDKDGEQLKSSILIFITNDKEAVVTVHDSKRHGFQEGDLVTFQEVQGMIEVNGNTYTVTNVKSPVSFAINCDSTNFKPYTREGRVDQQKSHVKIQFRSLKDSLDKPVPDDNKDGMYLCDWEKIGYPEQLHLVFNAVLDYAQINNFQLPELNNETHANKLLELTKQRNLKNKQMNIEGSIIIEEINENLVKDIALYARANICPQASFWGGIIAQEVVKLTGKFTPLRQWLHYEVFEALPEQKVQRSLQNTRYDHMIAIFGNENVQKLHQINTFLIGAGALGCELIKLFALMGLSCGEKGKLLVTDDDNIEISNLNRQFLFRPNNVGQSKSECAVNAGKVFNPDFNVKGVKNRVALETESYFNDDFWNSLDFVVNAVDNVKARLFVDSQCVWYGKPLFESGTLGTKCNSQVIIPKLTQSYGDSQDPQEESIPLCTLKNFPNQIEHTIQWARDKFEGQFAEAYAELAAFVTSKDRFLKKINQEFEEKRKTGMLSPLRTSLENVKSLFGVYKARSFEECVKMGRLLFQDYHHNQIAQLLYAYPLEHKTTEGLPFWSGPKRPPKILNFDMNDPIHLEFIQSASNIYAFMLGLPYCHDKQKIKDILKNVKVEPFQPKNMTIKADDKDTNTIEKAEDDEPACMLLIKELESTPVSGKNELKAVEFEKDDPTNWHIEFIGAVSNLRARNYQINEVDNFKVKLIAGKIIPALATTTSMVVGSVGLEIIKYILKKDISKMKNSFMNLALPLWLFSEPLPPIQIKDKEYDPIMMCKSVAIPPNWTTWDKIEVKGPLTLKQFIEFFKDKYKVNISSMTYEKYAFYVGWQKQTEEKLKTDISKIIENISQKELPLYKRYIPIIVGADLEGDEEISVEMPIIKYEFK